MSRSETQQLVSRVTTCNHKVTALAKCGKRTTVGTLKRFKRYATENKSITKVPEFYLLSELVNFCT
jgi:hypothetical protein